MEKLNLASIENMGDKFPISGLCLVATYSKQPTKNGGFYFGGQLSTKEGTVDFKSWSNSSAYATLDTEDIKGSVVNIVGEVNVFNGTKSIIVSNITVLQISKLSELGLSEGDFLYSKYNIDAYFVKFDSIMHKNLSENALAIYNEVMDKYGERIKEEFAAVNHHDNCRGGLLAHTYKVCQIASIVGLYPEVSNWIGKDLLYLGCALHDIGKIFEYNNGDISAEGRINSHMVLGAVLVATEFADLICEKMGEQFYYELLSVISSHSGEYGERPRTVVAYVVHQLDMLDAVMTGLNEQLDGAKKGDVQQYDGFKLS